LSEYSIGTSENYGKGTLLEDLTKEALTKIGFTIELHYTNQGGCDAVGNLPDLSSACECLNWYGGYIHPSRWDSIEYNLEVSEASYKFLVCFGVNPSKVQYKKAENKNINIIHYNRQMTLEDEDKISLLNWLHRQIGSVLGVITNSVSDRLLSLMSRLEPIFMALCNLKNGISGKRLLQKSVVSFVRSVFVHKRVDSRLAKNRLTVIQ